MKTIFLTALSAGMFLTATTAQESPEDVQTHPIDAKMSKCMELDYSTQGMASCMDRAMQDWDSELNVVYKKLMDKLVDKKSQETLRSTQRHWIAFRDSEFLTIETVYQQAYNEAGGGTLNGLMAGGAKLELVRGRALQLTAHYQSLTDVVGDK